MKRFIFAALALTALVSCHKEEPYKPQQWEFDKYSNPDVRAGDDFYNFVNGRGLDGPGSDDWTVFARWKKHSEDFTDRIYDDTPGNPIPEMARLIELRDEAMEFNSFDRSVEDMYGRLGKIGRMKDIGELPEALADYSLMGYKLLMIEPVSLGGHKYGICPMVIPAKMCPELSREDIEDLGLDYDEYAAKYELASKAEEYILSKIQTKGGISMLDADPGTASDLCAMNEYIGKTRRSMTKAGGSALERFAARLGNKNPDFVVLDETSRLFFELLDKMDGSMVEEMNAFLWCSALAYDADMIFGPAQYVSYLLAMAVPELMINASKLYCETEVNVKLLGRNMEIFEELRAALLDRIDKSDWMSGSTKKLAKEKLMAMECHNGILDWDKFTAPMPESDNFCSAMHEMFASQIVKLMAISDENTNFELTLAYQYSAPMAGSPAFSVNSTYYPESNVMCILPSTWILADMNPEFPYTMFLVGHEMCHGFDSNGAHYDSNGNFCDWWALDDKLEFKSMQEQMVNTFNQYYVSGETFADGRKTLDENMADLGALEISWYACEKRLKGLYSGEALKDHESRFFRSYAWFWAKYMSDAEKEKMVRNDEHSIYELRVNGIVNNIDSWYDLFDVKRGDRLYLSPSRRVEFW